MRKFKRKIDKFIQQVSDKITGSGLMQDEITADGQDKVTKEMAEYARLLAADACVLLENNGVLPLNPDNEIAVFGRCQFDWFYVGYGSGGDVNPPYCVNLIEGLNNAGVSLNQDVLNEYQDWLSKDENKANHGWWGHWPMCHPEMLLDKAKVQKVAKSCDTALVVIGRAAGEDRENTLTKGSYYLTDEEKNMLETVTSAFKNTVVILNIGSIFDMSWVKEYPNVSAVLIAWQGGMESGNAVCDVLTGKVSPSGKLPDTIAKNYEDYPSSKDFGDKNFNNYTEDIFVGYRYFDTFAKDKVLYPFGFGLSYTQFSYDNFEFSENNGEYKLLIDVKNTGKFSGKESVLLWCKPPKGNLCKPEKVLTAFAKTKTLAPNEKEQLAITFDKKSFASFDDMGKTGFTNAFVLEKGKYSFFVGDAKVACIDIEKTECIEQCESVCNVKNSFDRKTAFGTETVPAGKVNLRQRIIERMPADVKFTGDKGYKLKDVADKKISLDDFVAQLDEKELEALTRGEGAMGSALGTAGNAGAFGGILPSLREKGVYPIITCDGPAGIRLKKYCALLPSSTALASTFDTKSVEMLYVQVGIEMNKHSVDVLLAPGMNIHRNPLCGRNFEYFSEDPLLTGKMAAAVVKGVQSQGVSCCPKHFACNNQETRRNRHDSRVSERALREIYLRCFEIVVKESNPNTLMTSYNKINGVWSHYNYDLVTTVLRKEWGFDGVVVTDWWMQRSKSPEFKKIRDNAYRVRAQVDVLMPGNMGRLEKGYKSDGTLLKTLDKPDGITHAELVRTAKNVLGLILKTRY
jgi:beta-glucosidase